MRFIAGGEVSKWSQVMPESFEAAKQSPDPRDAAVLQREHMDIIRELMMTLMVVTHAGQLHVMNRALKILRSDVSRAGLALTDTRAVMMADALREMERETVRVVPRPATFNARASIVLDGLSALWRER
jgi:hypothetical protein